MQVNPIWPVESRFPQLEKDISADVVVVGGGVAGMFCEFQLSKLGYNTILLEQDEIGSAASGASSGILYYGSGTNYLQATQLFGAERAEMLWQETAKVIKEVVNIAKDEGAIANCGLRTCGSIMAAKNDSEAKDLEIEHDLLSKIGIPTKLLSAEEVKSYLPNSPFWKGLFFYDVAQIHPARLASAIAKNHGLKVYENSIAQSWNEEKSGKVVIQTPKGRVECSKAIIATNSQPYFDLDKHFEIESSVILASQPMETIKNIFPQEIMIWTMEDKYDIIYPRDDRLILELYALGEEESKLSYYYPGVEFKIEQQWGDIWSKPRDWLPILGKVSPNIAVAIGMGDQGVIMSWASSKHVANVLENKKDWLLELTSPMRFN